MFSVIADYPACIFYVSLSPISRITSLLPPNTNKKSTVICSALSFKVVPPAMPFSDIYVGQFAACTDARTEQSYYSSF